MNAEKLLVHLDKCTRCENPSPVSDRLVVNPKTGEEKISQLCPVCRVTVRNIRESKGK